MPYIITDIDGVFNPFDAETATHLEGFTAYTFGGQEAHLHAELHRKWIHKLSDHATFMWASAWEEKSNLLLNMLDINQEWNRIPLQYEDVGLGTWKIKPVRQWVERNVPAGEKVVWLDDELEDDVFRWAAQRGNMLAVKPDSYSGATVEEFERIHTFLTS